jgi:hypothetical protein
MARFSMSELVALEETWKREENWKRERTCPHGHTYVPKTRKGPCTQCTRYQRRFTPEQREIRRRLRANVSPASTSKQPASVAEKRRADLFYGLDAFFERQQIRVSNTNLAIREQMSRKRTALLLSIESRRPSEDVEEGAHEQAQEGEFIEDKPLGADERIANDGQHEIRTKGGSTRYDNLIIRK